MRICRFLKQITQRSVTGLSVRFLSNSSKRKEAIKIYQEAILDDHSDMCRTTKQYCNAGFAYLLLNYSYSCFKSMYAFEQAKSSLKDEEETVEEYIRAIDYGIEKIDKLYGDEQHSTFYYFDKGYLLSFEDDILGYFGNFRCSEEVSSLPEGVPKNVNMFLRNKGIEIYKKSMETYGKDGVVGKDFSNISCPIILINFGFALLAKSHYNYYDALDIFTAANSRIKLIEDDIKLSRKIIDHGINIINRPVYEVEGKDIEFHYFDENGTLKSFIDEIHF